MYHPADQQFIDLRSLWLAWSTAASSLNLLAFADLTCLEFAHFADLRVLHD
jgi:hypothetical protein